MVGHGRSLSVDGNSITSTHHTFNPPNIGMLLCLLLQELLWHMSNGARTENRKNPSNQEFIFHYATEHIWQRHVFLSADQGKEDTFLGKTSHIVETSHPWTKFIVQNSTEEPVHWKRTLIRQGTGTNHNRSCGCDIAVANQYMLWEKQIERAGVFQSQNGWSKEQPSNLFSNFPLIDPVYFLKMKTWVLRLSGSIEEGLS